MNLKMRKCANVLMCKYANVKMKKMKKIGKWANNPLNIRIGEWNNDTSKSKGCVLVACPLGEVGWGFTAA